MNLEDCRDVILTTASRTLSRESDFFFARTSQSMQEAEDSKLPRLREQAMRAAAAWREMHEKARLFEDRQRR